MTKLCDNCKHRAAWNQPVPVPCQTCMGDTKPITDNWEPK